MSILIYSKLRHRWVWQNHRLHLTHLRTWLFLVLLDLLLRRVSDLNLFEIALDLVVSVDVLVFAHESNWSQSWSFEDLVVLGFGKSEVRDLFVENLVFIKVTLFFMTKWTIVFDL